MKPKFHIEIIECPECGYKQWAKVEHTIPWHTRIHTCIRCEYLIMESEWNKVENKNRNQNELPRESNI
jgi:uncharacterized protein (DUF2225 family)